MRRRRSTDGAGSTRHPASALALRCVSAAVGWLQIVSVTNCTHVPYGAPNSVYHFMYHIPRAQPAHHFYVRTDAVRHPTPGGRGSPPIRGVVARVDWQRYYAAPTSHQPLSHGAKRRDSSPFRGAEGWAEACGVYATVYHDADACVSLMPVRGGVLDAPRL